MPANIDTTDGISSFVAAHEDAWHRMGVTLNHSFTALEAMEEGHLGDWDVRKIPMFAKDEKTGLTIEVPGRASVVRTNPVNRKKVDWLGDVGQGYSIIQNEDHAAFLDALVDESGAHFDTAGAIDGGRKVFITMKLPGHINIGGIDPVENYIAAVNSHDGTSSFALMVTPVRVVCANTIQMAYQNHSHMIKISHRTNAQKNLTAKAREALDISFNYLDAFQKEAEQMIQTTLTEAQFESIIMREFGPADDASPTVRTRSQNKVDDIMSLFAEANTQEGVRETVWAGFNALTEWADHFAPTRGDEAHRDQYRAEKAILDPYLKTQAHRLMSALV